MIRSFSKTDIDFSYPEGSGFFETAVRTNPQTVAKVSQTPKGRPFSEAAFLTL
ncbi:MAG: hypothetical protein ACJAVM_000340 [Sulfitobacter sp.]|jgi:hypothetical protein